MAFSMTTMVPALMALVAMFAGMEALKISSCSSHPMGNIINLAIVDINPDPVELPGKFSVGGTIEVKKDITGGKISADVTVHRKVLWLFDVKAPCIDTGIKGLGVGSCHYDNLCDILTKMVPDGGCPAFMGELSCHCPYKKGIYKLEPQTVNVKELPGIVSMFTDATYKVQLKFKNDSTGEELGCYKIELEIGDAEYHNQKAILDSPVRPGQNTVTG